MQKTNAMRLLTEAHVDFQAYEYDPAEGIDAKSVAVALHKPAAQIFKTLVTEASPNECFVFVVPADSELDLKKAAQSVGQKSVSMLPQKRLLSMTGYIHGGCSPVGMKKAFPTKIDETAMLFDTICISGGKVGLTLEVNVSQLRTFLDAELVDLVRRNEHGFNH